MLLTTKSKHMDIKKSIIRLLISLILSPIVVYIILWAAKLAGSTYEMSHGETFIIWLLMAIVINLSMTNKN
jgi:hypothetical protein